VDEPREKAWTAVCSKWGTHHEEPCESLDEAVAYLWYGTEHNLCLALGVVGPDGQVYDESDVYEAIAEYEGRVWS
jgi:hypothetical protein